MRKLSPICPYENYTVGVIDGYGILRDWKGNYSSLDDLKKLIESMQATVALMEDGNWQGSEIVQYLEHQHYIGLFENKSPSNFVFYPTDRKQLYGKGSGVYFIGDTLRPERVKIGMSNNITSRTRGLEWVVKGDVEIYAVFFTADYKVYETALHGMFSQYRIDGEWFKKKPVLSYVNSLMEEYRK